jgi:hypothetical protein
LQVGWWINYGFYTFLYFKRVSDRHELDCFVNLGAYKFCVVTQRLSIYTSILLLMTQALLSRMIAPGISNFVNASVRRSHPRTCCSTSEQLHADGFVFFGSRLPHAPQVLHSDSDGGTGETSGAEAGGSDARSKSVVIMTLT